MPLVKLDESVQALLQAQMTIRTLACGLREVLHNAVDAGATRIDVSVDHPRRSFTVADNGCGMNAEALRVVGKRFYTSKGSHKGTFGFKGEALNALAAVSTLHIASRVPGASGLRVLLANGNRSPVESDETVTEAGTVVSATDLFGQMPVRVHQHHQTTKLEMLGVLRDMVLDVALFHPGLMIRVRFRSAPNVVSEFVVPPSEGPQRVSFVLETLYGGRYHQPLESVSASFEGYFITGVIGCTAVPTKTFQKVYLNARRVLDGSFMRALSKPFAAAAFGTVAPAALDTAHPLSQSLLQSPQRAARLTARHPVFVFRIEAPPTAFLVTDPTRQAGAAVALAVARPLILKLIAAFLEVQGYDRHRKRLPSRATPPPVDWLWVGDGPLPALDLRGVESPHFKDLHSVALTRETLTKARVVAQVDRKFILVTARMALEGSEPQPTLLALDQHAAAERIKVERLLQGFLAQAEQNQLSEPVDRLDVTLSGHELVLFQTHAAEFAYWGVHYDLLDIPPSPFQDHQLCLTHLPGLLAAKAASNPRFIAQSLLEHAYDLEEHRVRRVLRDPVSPSSEWFCGVKTIPRAYLRLLQSQACRTAVMFGDLLTRDAMAVMITELGQCVMPFQCAHGRPSVVPLAVLTMSGSMALETNESSTPHSPRSPSLSHANPLGPPSSMASLGSSTPGPVLVSIRTSHFPADNP